MPKPICVPCQGFYKPLKNGTWWLEQMPAGQGDTETQPAKDRLGWVPYKIWTADKWKCPGCGHEIIVGHGGPVTEHNMDNFQSFKHLITDTINDC